METMHGLFPQKSEKLNSGSFMAGKGTVSLRKCPVQNNLCEFWKLGVADLQKVNGIGKQRACQMASMFALFRRRNAAEVVVKPKISSRRDTYTVFHSLTGEFHYEEFRMLLLDRANKIINTVKVTEGGISGTVVDPKKIFYLAIEHHASSSISFGIIIADLPYLYDIKPI